MLLTTYLQRRVLFIVPVVAAVLILCGGCAIPYSRSFKPQADEAHATDAVSGVRYQRPQLTVVDAETSRAIDDASAVIVIHRCKVHGMCCSATSSPREPIVHVEPFSKLRDLDYHQDGLIVILPIWVEDLGTEFMHATVYAYKAGYEPALVELADRGGGSYRYPNPVRLRRCESARSLPILLGHVRQKLNEEESPYATKVASQLQKLMTARSRGDSLL